MRTAVACAAFVAGTIVGAAPAVESGDDRRDAIAALLSRSARVSPGSPEARSLAGEMGELAGQLLEEGEVGRAVELLGEALAIDDQNGFVLAELTLAYVRAEDFDAARFYLRLAEAEARDAPPEIYRVLGDAYQGLHRLDDAAAAWTEAARLSGQDPATLSRLARVRDELAVSRGQRTLATEHFALFADPAVSEAALARTAAGLESAYASIGPALGARLLQPQVVVLHAGRYYFALASVPDWAAGVYDGKIRLAVEPGGDEDPAASAVLTHELAHALLRRASGDRAPAWLHEGIAQWSQGRRMPRRELAAALGGPAASSLPALEASLRGKLDRRSARAAYAETLSLLEHLIALRGEGAITCIVSRLAEGRSMAQALRSETGMDEAQLYASWRTWTECCR